ncbi:MotA/TolQ/ExbB proton channel family protein [Alienimonas sp. DA493]|uniref:MotA/TolQ/ExbB proton channel family protein n=1 Tax=Alienimonas sp. DA493 TaxID=3373605 RepID=UPI00375423E9
MADSPPPRRTPAGAGSDAAEIRRKRTFWLWAIGISLAVLVIAPFVGLVGTMAGMFGAYQETLQSATSPEPADLADGVSSAMWTTAGGFAVATVALLVLIVSLVRVVTLSTADPGPPTRTVRHDDR